METTIFETRFKKLGGMTPELSKAIGQRPTAYSDHVVADSLRLYHIRNWRRERVTVPRERRGSSLFSH